MLWHEAMLGSRARGCRPAPLPTDAAARRPDRHCPRRPRAQIHTTRPNAARSRREGPRHLARAALPFSPGPPLAGRPGRGPPPRARRRRHGNTHPLLAQHANSCRPGARRRGRPGPSPTPDHVPRAP
jgi:hypothetical protein